MIVAVDFDGTIAVDGFPDISAAREVPDSIAAVKYLQEAGHTVVLWTCREDHPDDDDPRQYLSDALHWLSERGVDLEYANALPAEEEFRTFGRRTKVYADVYVDDRNIGGFPGWHQVCAYVDAASAVAEDGHIERESDPTEEPPAVPDEYGRELVRRYSDKDDALSVTEMWAMSNWLLARLKILEKGAN